LLATLLAPATRFGYLIYPLDLLTCAVLLTPFALTSGAMKEGEALGLGAVGDLEEPKREPHLG